MATAIDDLNFALALAAAKAAVTTAGDQAKPDLADVAALLEENDRLRQENARLQRKITKLEEHTCATTWEADNDSILFYMRTPGSVKDIHQVDIIREYIEKCRRNNSDSGTVLVAMSCDVIAAVSDPDLQHGQQEVAFAGDWISEGMTIAFTNSIPHEACISSLVESLSAMVSKFRDYDCFAVAEHRWKPNPDTCFKDLREQIMFFLIALASRDGIDEFVLSLLCSELLEIFVRASNCDDSKQWLNCSQNASYVCRCVERILQDRLARHGKGDSDTGCTIADKFLSRAGRRVWVDIWKEILTASVVLCEKLPLATAFVWRLAAFVENGVGVAWNIGLTVARRQ